LLVLLTVLGGLLFVSAVLWQVFPIQRGGTSTESISDLKNRLAKERAQKRRRMEEDLSEIQMENEKLRREIQRLHNEKR